MKRLEKRTYYACQGCGHSTRYAWFPCIYCGGYSIDNASRAKAHILSNAVLDCEQLLFAGRKIQAGDAPEQFIAEWDEIFHKVYTDLTAETEFNDPGNKKQFYKELIKERIAKRFIRCKHCENIIRYAAQTKCYECDKPLGLTYEQRVTIVFSWLLIFLDSYQPSVGNIATLDLFLGALNLALYDLIENDRLPDAGLLSDLDNCLNALEYIGSPEFNGRVVIAEREILVGKDVTEKDMQTLTPLSVQIFDLQRIINSEPLVAA